MLFGTRKKLEVAAYSATVVFVGMSNYPWIKRSLQLGFIPSRKYFHLLGFILFTPNFIVEVYLVLSIYIWW